MEKLAVYSQKAARSSPPDCPVRQAGSGEKAALGSRRRRTTINHRTVRWCTEQCPVSRLRRSHRSRKPSQQRTAKIHRTVCCAPDCPVSQRSAAQSARDAWPGQRSEGGTGLSGAPTAPSLQRSAAPKQERNPHRTVRWCTGLSGAPGDRRQELPSWNALNGS
jgi:hypothetical protein